MSDLDKFEHYIINQIMAKYPLGFTEATRVFKIMKDKGIISRQIVSESDADALIDNEIKAYLLPKGFFRFKNYTKDELKKLGIALQFVREKNDGWGTKI